MTGEKRKVGFQTSTEQSNREENSSRCELQTLCFVVKVVVQKDATKKTNSLADPSLC
jgi:hypothetical protein